LQLTFSNCPLLTFTAPWLIVARSPDESGDVRISARNVSSPRGPAILV
jgi:hypothetical protein